MVTDHHLPEALSEDPLEDAPAPNETVNGSCVISQPSQIEQCFDTSRHVAVEVLETITRWLRARTDGR